MINALELNVWQRARTEGLKRTYVLPAAFLLIGLLVPFFFARPEMAVRNQDSFEYITGSQSILHGQGYLAMSGRPQTVFPPGYSLTIVPFALFLDSIQAAKAVSLIASAVSVLLLFLIARDWFGTRVGVLSALLFAFLPVRVWLSQAAQSESLYVMLLLLAIWITVRTKISRVVPAAAVGVVVGWAYLTRPEAVILMAILTIFLLVSFVRTRENAKPLFVFVAAFFAIVLPYILWLSFQTGNFVLTGKGRGEIGRGIARFEGKPDVLMRRLANDDSAIVIATTSPGIKETVVHAVRNLGVLKRLVLTETGVEPIAGGFLLIGLLEVARRLFKGGVWLFGLLQLFFILHLVLYVPFWIEGRLIYAGSAALTVWMAIGAFAIFKFVTRTSESRRLKVFGMTVVGTLAVLLMTSYVFRLSSTTITDEQGTASQQLVQVIAQRPELAGQGIIGEYPGAAFMTAAHHEWMPYCDLEQLRRFATSKRAALVAFSDRDMLTPATQKLVDGDYAASEAEMLATLRSGNQNLYLFRLMPTGNSTQAYR